MKVEVGKRYIRRDGKITDPVYEAESNGPGREFCYAATAPGDCVRLHRPDGTHFYDLADCDFLTEFTGVQLEAGKRYVRRDGQVTPPLVRIPGYKTWPFSDGGAPYDRLLWAANGSYGSGRQSPEDIVSEFVVQAGKRYKLRNGGEVGPISATTLSDFPLCAIYQHRFRGWTAAGQSDCGPGFDIVAEVAPKPLIDGPGLYRTRRDHAWTCLGVVGEWAIGYIMWTTNPRPQSYVVCAASGCVSDEVLSDEDVIEKVSE